MSTTPTPNQPKPEPTVKAKAAAIPQPLTSLVAEPAASRRGSIGRFFSNMFLLIIALGAAFGAGYYVMDQEARVARLALLQQQSSSHDRIATLETQLLNLQENRQRENSVELDLSEVFAPIKMAVSRLAEAQMGIVAQQISAEIVKLVESDVHSVNASAAITPLASIPETAIAALDPELTESETLGAEAPDTPTPEPVADLISEPPGDQSDETTPTEPGLGATVEPGASRTPANEGATLLSHPFDEGFPIPSKGLFGIGTSQMLALSLGEPVGFTDIAADRSPSLGLYTKFLPLLTEIKPVWTVSQTEAAQEAPKKPTGTSHLIGPPEPPVGPSICFDS